ncbi:CoA-transferase [Dinoroseobacter shibae DFL 12 = DSM 16493]|jgi:2-methylfumaryl-CoA isomerase|uniref:CoA-transferase n=1 Tax=Dinoroseobacter shibae (strain DSM 16493 / NCIMB 14021 / DFL 12) TaxID=398580 RepID=A8LSM9_DINSH|nr:CoA transferase [Dinoroseobacter shibae]ABV94228.1 CoA-transferase [Dinoroseobacter shibae DFL 12 = DSM 16493]URF45669.1 CoA transferase [Dinoroseobacter shibae]URF49974.1 CoA transferase [Dinoroseobacter shibae]
MPGILNGLRVVEGSAFVAVPLAGMTLAQMGADVIRFDRLQGGLDSGRWPLAPSGKSLFWAGLNKGKRSLAVDMSHPEGKELITRTITAPGEDAGVFLTNLRVRGWMDYETLSKLREDLIMVTLLGDRHGRPQVDYTVNPALGIPDITGPEGHDAPVANALPAWDLMAGHMCVSSVLAAERHRLRKGVGQEVVLTLKDVAAATLGHLGMIGDAVLNETARTKSGNALYGAYGQDFLCADGRRIMVIGLTGRQWSGLVKTTGTQTEMAELARATGRDLGNEGVRWELRREITEILTPWFAARPAAVIGEIFDDAKLTWSEFRTVKEAVEQDPDLSPDNPVFTALAQEGLGTFPVPGHAAVFSALAREAPKPAPALGSHTEEILSEVTGLDDTEIARLFDEGIVGSSARRTLYSAA